MPIRRHISDLQCVDGRGLVAIRGGASNSNLSKALKVLVPETVQGQDIVRITPILGIKSLLEEVYISCCCLHRHFKGGLGLMAGVVGRV